MKGKRLLMVLVAAVALSALLIAGCAPATPTTPTSPTTPTTPTTPSQPGDVKVNWRMQTPFPAGFLFYQGGTMFADAVTQMSGGRITVTNNPSGAIVDGLKEMRAVHEGVLDAAWTGPHYHTSETGLAGSLFNLYPAGTGPQEFIMWNYEGGGAELWQKLYDRKNLNVVAMLAGMTSAELFGWFAEPVTSMADFQGMKFRTAGIWGEMLNEAGAAVVTMPGGEVYEAAQRGVIDAFEFSTPGIDYSAGFHELGAYCHGPGIHAPQAAFEALINKDQWNRLTPDLQAIVRGAADVALVRSWAMVDYGDVLGMQKLRDYGTQFVYLPEAVQLSIVELANKKYDEIAARDEFFAEVLQSQRDFVKAYRDYKSFTQPDPNLMTYMD